MSPLSKWTFATLLAAIAATVVTACGGSGSPFEGPLPRTDRPRLALQVIAW